MSRDLVWGWPAMTGSRMVLQILASGRELRAVVAGRMVPPEMRAVLDCRGGKRSASVSFIAAVRDRDEGRSDAAAGCEFVDDRIRLLE